MKLMALPVICPPLIVPLPLLCDAPPAPVQVVVAVAVPLNELPVWVRFTVPAV